MLADRDALRQTLTWLGEFRLAPCFAFLLHWLHLYVISTSNLREYGSYASAYESVPITNVFINDRTTTTTIYIMNLTAVRF